MLAYHGSAVKGLRTLRPYKNPQSNLDYPCVYLSQNKALAAVYIWSKPYKWMTFELREDGMPVYNESFKGGLYEFYAGKSGSIYTCVGDFEADEKTKIKCAVVSRKPVEIAGEERVDDAYERILSYEREGKLIINHFETLSDAQRARDKRMVLSTIKSLELYKGGHPLSAFVREKFPEYWEEALREAEI